MPTEARREPRMKVMLPGRLRARGPEHDAWLLDVSAGGLLLRAATSPPRGSFVEVRVAGHSLVGVVGWSGEDRFGVKLRDRIDTAALLRGDGSQITLKSRAECHEATWRGANPRFGGGAGMARAVQFGALATAGIAAAVFLAHAVGIGLAPLRQAETAMANEP